MRTTGKIAIITSVLAGAAVPATAATAQAAPAWVAYHNLSASQSVARVKQLKDQGYRPITVNVSDGERYAAVWVKGGSSGKWGIWQGMSADGFQKRFDAGLEEGRSRRPSRPPGRPTRPCSPPSSRRSAARSWPSPASPRRASPPPTRRPPGRGSR
ncbi:hypothetical protein ACFQQB_32395 [Nonomuraea rubra]|uniref:hypothetical protein n=1 Tax=Nonomuraea rubra TaxID=46180 RepID=UPI003616E8CF